MTMLDPAAGGLLYPRGTSHPNPMFDFLTGFVPRRLKDLFRWAEYLAYSSAHVYAVIKKFGEYPITRFVYETESVEERARHKRLVEKNLRGKGFLTKVSFDKFLYGNVFVSVFKPFKRFLRCGHCKNLTAIERVAYKYNREEALFEFACTVESCRRANRVAPTDVRTQTPEAIRLIRWDPKQIEIDHNPVTDQSVYYYAIPEWMRDAVGRGARHLINTMPFELLAAMRRGKVFRFRDGEVYHLKVPGPAGVEAQWGFPPITSAIKNFLFAATLRKANEAIALERITPMRILHPAQSTPMGDPNSGLNLGGWADRVRDNYLRYRNDPLHLMISPVPIGVQDIGGDGRALLTLGEVQEAEKNIILSMGVPMEFLTGGLGQTRGEITLRMIENQLQTHIEDLNDLIQWIDDKCAAFLGYRNVVVRLADFKMIDDQDSKSMTFALWQAGTASDTRMHEALNMDYHAEIRQKTEDLLAAERENMRRESEIAKLRNSLSAQAQRQAQASQTGQLYDTQAVIAEAQRIAAEMAQLDPGSRQSQMDGLQGRDPVMYNQVRGELEQMKQDQDQQARSAVAQGAV